METEYVILPEFSTGEIIKIKLSERQKRNRNNTMILKSIWQHWKKNMNSDWMTANGWLLKLIWNASTDSDIK